MCVGPAMLLSVSVPQRACAALGLVVYFCQSWIDGVLQTLHSSLGCFSLFLFSLAVYLLLGPPSTSSSHLLARPLGITSSSPPHCPPLHHPTTLKSLFTSDNELSVRVCVCIKCMHLLELLYEGFLLLYSHLVQVALVWWMPMWCSGSVLVLTGMRLCVCGFVPKQFILQKLIHNDSSVHCLSFEDLCEMCLVLDKNKVFHIYLKKSKSLRLKKIILTTFDQQ